MEYVWFYLALAGYLANDRACGIEFGHSYGSHMVLQRGPQRAMLYGHANVVGDTVTVYKNGVSVGTTNVQHSTNKNYTGYWELLLPPESHRGPFTITASSSDGKATLTDVLFGDVWVCSGQSNMAFTMHQVMNSTAEIQNSLHYHDVRMLNSKRVMSATEVEEANIIMHWMKPTKGQIDRFSAVCFMFGRNLQEHLKVPIGLIETSWGGTPVEAWSSPDALAACHHQGKRALNPHSPSVLWNAMVEPFLKTTIKGAIWYQGEANSRHPDQYACSFPAMIADWRQKFHVATHGQTDSQFPFGFVQLAPNANSSLVGGFPPTRWAQTANVGHVPNAKMPKTFMAVAVDLPDFHSPYGTIHPRYKQDVALRLTLGARAVAYGEHVVYQGPFPTAFHLDDHHHTLRISLDKGTTDIVFHNTTGFEICCASTADSDCAHAAWHFVPIRSIHQSEVTVGALCAHGLHAAGVRYLWHTSPCELKMCPLYGRTNNLPVPPFIKTGGFAAGTGIVG